MRRTIFTTLLIAINLALLEPPAVNAQARVESWTSQYEIWNWGRVILYKQRTAGNGTETLVQRSNTDNWLFRGGKPAGTKTFPDSLYSTIMPVHPSIGLQISATNNIGSASDSTNMFVEIWTAIGDPADGPDDAPPDSLFKLTGTISTDGNSLAQYQSIQADPATTDSVTVKGWLNPVTIATPVARWWFVLARTAGNASQASGTKPVILKLRYVTYIPN